MRTVIPKNEVSIDYCHVLDSFISLLRDKQGDNLQCVFLSGSYARGDATSSSELDVFCIFETLTSNVLRDVGYVTRNTPIPYRELELNAQCFSAYEFQSDTFNGWSEKSAKVLDSVLLYGNDLCGDAVSIADLQTIYKRYLADILMGIRHYVCVDEPSEKLTHQKIKTHILKPLMFPLRMERYCSCGYFPLTISELRNSLDDDDKFLVDYFCNSELFTNAISLNHRNVLEQIYHAVLRML